VDADGATPGGRAEEFRRAGAMMVWSLPNGQHNQCFDLTGFPARAIWASIRVISGTPLWTGP
jgi:hypothetical protein